jgi:hypothetical protein
MSKNIIFVLVYLSESKSCDRVFGFSRVNVVVGLNIPHFFLALSYSQVEVLTYFTSWQEIYILVNVWCRQGKYKTFEFMSSTVQFPLGLT